VNQPFSTKRFLYGGPGGYRFLEGLELRKLGQIHFKVIGPVGHREQIGIRHSEMIAQQEFCRTAGVRDGLNNRE
jgi:hypothetical protein